MRQEEIERFQNWLQAELDLRNLTANQLAKTAGISHSVFSRVREGKLPKWKTCMKIATALDIAPAEVFRAASLLPPISEKEDFTNQILYIYDKVSTEKKRMILHILKGINEIARSEGDVEQGNGL